MMINQVWLSGRQKKHKMQIEKPTHEKGTQVTFPRYIFSSLIFFFLLKTHLFQPPIHSKKVSMTSGYIPPSEFLYCTPCCWWWSIEVDEDDEATLAGRVKLLLNLSIFLASSWLLSKLKNSFGLVALAFCMLEASELGFWLRGWCWVWSPGLLPKVSGLNKSLASSVLPVRALKKDKPLGHFMSFSCSPIMSSTLALSDDAWGMRNMFASSLGNPSLAVCCWKLGEDNMEVAEESGLWPQLKSGGGLIGMVDGFEGREVEEEVFLVEEKSWER